MTPALEGKKTILGRHKSWCKYVYMYKKNIQKCNYMLVKMWKMILLQQSCLEFRA